MLLLPFFLYLLLLNVLENERDAISVLILCSLSSELVIKFLLLNNIENL